MLTMNEIFSENLSKLLARRDIPQSALAEELGVSNAIVSEWVKGRKIPRMNKLSHICDFLQCDIDHLMKENGIDTLPHDGAIAVLSIGTGECTEHCIKHVIQADVGVVITSDNPAYPSKLVPAEQHPTILGIPVGFTRTHEKNPPPWKG